MTEKQGREAKIEVMMIKIKNSENLPEALTDNVIDTAITDYSSSNPTLGMPQSLLTYPAHLIKVILTELKIYIFIVMIKAILLIDLK